MNTLTWSRLATSYGRAAVVHASMTEEELAAETARQTSELLPMIRPLIEGAHNALDFGCGYGRFLPMLLELVPGHVDGYEPCPEMLRLGHRSAERVSLFGDVPALRYDVVFTLGVLGDPGVPIEETADILARVLSSRGLLVVADHMPPVAPEERWWLFRPQSFYGDLFARRHIAMKRIGSVMQRENEVTVLAGRRTTP